MGFTRRYPTFPSNDEISAIEGVVIIDNAPPQTASGSNTGVACCVGEFANAFYAVVVSSTGIVTTRPKPIEIFGGQDLIDKGGPFDETLGQFGTALGSGWCAVRNKQYRRLVIAPVDNITPVTGGQQGGIRLWRELPTNASVTDPTPIVPVSAAVVLAGREFKSSTNRVRVAQNVPFSSGIAFVTGTDGVVATAAAAATQTFNSAGSSFVVAGVQVGDILVSGVIGTSLTGNAGTFRITVVAATALTVQAMDGTNFAFTTETAVPFRIHPAATADSAGSVSAVHAALASTTGSTVIARPLDASITSATVLTPTVVPSAGSATSWEPLSGLTAYTRPTAVTGGNSLIYDANIHAPNLANNSSMDARYLAAMNGTISDSDPARQINMIGAARKSSTIRASLKANVGTASAQGLTRRAIISPELSVVSQSTVQGSADPGVGANRTDRVDYEWPGNIALIPEAIGFSIATADGKTTTDGILDETADFWLMSAESILAPEFDPAQEQEPIPTILAPIMGYQRGNLPNFTMQSFIALKAAGIVGLRFATSGPIFQSGVTTSLTTGQLLITRRRMADYIQDSCAQLCQKYAKLPKTESNKDNVYSDVDAFLFALKSPDNPPTQRIENYSIDARSGNTLALDNIGAFVLVIRARLLGELLDIVLNTTIGETVTIQDISTAA